MPQYDKKEDQKRQKIRKRECKRIISKIKHNVGEQD